MTTILGSAWWLIVTLALLVTFHEFGHYWVARRCGVKVLRFSVGFGRAIWSRIGRDGTEYRVAMIPLGGYVKMLDAREGEPIPEEWKDQEFTGKPVWQRIAIVAAGPIFNIIFAIAAFWLMFVIGLPGHAPTLSKPAAHTLAAQAGVRAGDRILAIDGSKIGTWSDAMDAIANDAVLHQSARLRVRGTDGQARTLTLALDTLPEGGLAKSFDRIGLAPGGIPPVIGKIESDSAAQKAGLRIGDRILGIDGHPVGVFDQLPGLVQKGMKQHDALALTVQRDRQQLQLHVTPTRKTGADGKTRWVVGIYPQEETVLVRYGPVRAFGQSLKTTWDKFASTVHWMGMMIVGKSSTRNLGGVITIARGANYSAQMGLSRFLGFLALVSLSLAIINLLPIPVLDGGHLLYYLIELVKGSPVSERVMIAGQFVGLALLTCIIGLALYNDILGIPS
jgi:regulator of sigma E protease